MEKYKKQVYKVLNKALLFFSITEIAEKIGVERHVIYNAKRTGLLDYDLVEKVNEMLDNMPEFVLAEEFDPNDLEFMLKFILKLKRGEYVEGFEEYYLAGIIGVSHRTIQRLLSGNIYKSVRGRVKGAIFKKLAILTADKKGLINE